MIQRLLLILALAVVAALLLAYSQMQREPLVVSGFVEADEIRLGSRVGGRVKQVLVEEGQRVSRKSGQPPVPLVVLEPFDLLERQRQAQATLAAAQAEYERLVAGFRKEEIAQAKAIHDGLKAKVERLEKGPRPQEIAAARELLNVAQAELVLANKNYQRTSQLRRTGAKTQDDLDRATEQKRAAEAMTAVRQNELDLLEEGTRREEIAEARAQREAAFQAYQLKVNGSRREDIQHAGARRDATQAALAAIDRQIEELAITSPVKEGIVESLELQPGDLVAAGAPVLSVMDTSKLWVRAYVPQKYLRMKEGQKLRVTVDSFPGEEFQGTVTFISRQAEFTPRNVQTPEERSKQVFRIKVTITAGREKLRPGMSADVWLEPLQ